MDGGKGSKEERLHFAEWARSAGTHTDTHILQGLGSALGFAAKAMAAIAASMGNGSHVMDPAPSSSPNGEADAAVREISQNGDVSDDPGGVEAIDGGEQAGGAEGRKAKEAERRRRRRTKKKKGPKKELTQTADQSEDNQNVDEVICLFLLCFGVRREK